MEGSKDPLKIIQAFAKENAHILELQFILNDDLEIDEICDKGLVNYIWRVKSKSSQESVIIKYGEEKLRCTVVGVEDLSLERQAHEYNSLKLLNELYPGSAPKVHCFDDKHHIIAMEELLDMEFLGDQSRRGHVDASGASGIGKLLAILHNRSYREQMSPGRWAELEEKFTQQEAKDWFEELSIKGAYEGFPGKIVPDGGMDIYKRILVLAGEKGWMETLLNTHRAKLCFIHADCHDNHVVLFNSSDRVALLDLEYAFLGHPISNFAATVSSYTLLYFRFVCKKSSDEVESFVNGIKQALTNAVSAYLEESIIYKDDGEKEIFLSKLALQCGHIFLQAALFSGTIDEQLMIPQSVKLRMLKQAGNLMNKHENIHTIQEFVDAVFCEMKDDESL